MPIVPAGDLTNLRSSPQMSTLYLVIQQPARYTVASDTFTVGDFVWYGTVRVAPTTDPITSLEVTAHADAVPNGVVILDGMTVMISNSAYGKWEEGIIAAHGDQTIQGAGNDDTLYISVASDLSAVDVGDFVVVLDEFRFRTLYPKVTEAAGVLSWFKYYGFFLDSIGEDGGDIGYTWAQLGAADANRRGASMPPVPIMSSHVVQFIDPDVGNVTIDFDWTDSYALAPGAAVDAWASVGENDHVGGSWNSAAQNPAAQTYSVLSGLRGFRITLELGTDGDDPIVEFRRGVRYVFTLRRPNQAQVGDPADAAPITDFMVDSISGSFDQGGWRTTVTVFENQASEFQITPGALVIIFSEDTYGSTKTSIGPDDSNFTDRENIVLVGHIADDSIRKDAETGDVTFDVVSVSELMKNRECYPVVIENDSVADEWYKTPTLTVDRASHHYLRWQTNLCLVADLYQTGDTKEVRAMDFMAGDAYSTVDTFIQDRLFARLLCDRFGRFAMVIDQQLETAAGAATLFTLADTDWMGEATLRQVNEPPVSVADTGGLFYNAGLIVPYLSHAPGEVSGYVGTPDQRMHLAISSQAQLNTVCGRLYAYRNNEWPELILPYSGNWRVFDIWPQEYVSVSLTTERHAFSSDLFIVREISFDYDPAIGVLFTTVSHELETDGPDGVTIAIPAELPVFLTTPTTSPPTTPPSPGVGGGGYNDTGRRIMGTNIGVVATDEIGAASPTWYKVTTGLPNGNERCWLLRRDPWHWWTTTTEKTLWGVFGISSAGQAAPYLYKMETFPYGTWTLKYEPAAASFRSIVDLQGSIEIEDRWYLLRNQKSWGAFGGSLWVHRSVDGGDNWTQLAALGEISQVVTWPRLMHKLAIEQHSAAQTQYVVGNSLHAVKDGAETTNEWTAFTTPSHYPVGSDALFIPYVNAAWVGSYLINTYNDVHMSEDEGVTWTDISPPVPASVMITQPFDGAVGYMIAFGINGAVYNTIDNGTTWTLWLDTGLIGTWARAVVVEFRADGTPENILAFFGTAPNEGVYLLHAGGLIDKTGNLFGVAPLLTSIAAMERDTVGSA